ncbi:hypothetical protein [Methanobacterium spitsbergense]|uniref:DUF3566 domain-containing protein n=1 Tax=Methanobacterium spitsbergense TaxID=2874285 RepID=A0A8T5V4X7_9EURY|nr:hypothetical protein [Methanobacterium spitsbergense]MBZ2166725.1 hypothetical protein [Methanobacterium spitsbergense]
MVDFKEIKSIELVPFTLMTSSVSAILAFIYAIILLITFGVLAAVVPTVGLVFASLGLSMLVIFPIGSFLVYVTLSFVSALIYNKLVPRLGGIKLGLEGDEVKSLPVVPFALITSCVGAVWAFIIGLLLAAIIVPLTTLTSTIIPLIADVTANATNMTPATLPTGSAVGTGGVVLALLLIIGLPIFVFVAGFIGNALWAIFYNFLIPRVGGVRLLFAPAGNAHEITSIPVVAAALALAVVATIFGIIQGLFSLVNGIMAGSASMAVGSLIGNIIGAFIGTFIMVAIITILYNFLAPRIGGIQLELK